MANPNRGESYPSSILLALAVLVQGAPCTTGAIVAAEAGIAGASWTAQQDHQNMMEQLGIKRLRPGPSGQAGATNAANYDPAKANPYPDLPDPLRLNNGEKVTTAEVWWN